MLASVKSMVQSIARELKRKEIKKKSELLRRKTKTKEVNFMFKLMELNDLMRL